MILDEILEKLKAAQSGSRDLDFDIAIYLGFRPHWSQGDISRRRLHDGITGSSIRAWTSTIERARHLIPEGYHWYVGTGVEQIGKNNGRRFEACCQPGYKPFVGCWYGHTAALALCSAALSTMIAK